MNRTYIYCTTQRRKRMTCSPVASFLDARKEKETFVMKRKENEERGKRSQNKKRLQERERRKRKGTMKSDED